MDLRGSMWNVHLGLVGQSDPKSGDLEERLKRVENECAVKDLLARYTYFYDAKDPDGLLDVFHEECVLVNPRGTYIGHDAIRRNYAFLMDISKVCLHFASNVVVRIDEGGRSGWMTAYYYDISATRDGKLVGTAGTYADRVTCAGEKWTIIERRITYNLRHLLTAEPPTSEVPPPTPTRKESSRDIVGRAFEM